MKRPSSSSPLDQLVAKWKKEVNYGSEIIQEVINATMSSKYLDSEGWPFGTQISERIQLKNFQVLETNRKLLTLRHKALKDLFDQMTKLDSMEELVLEMFKRELEVKRLIAEELFFETDRQILMIYLSAWSLDSFIIDSKLGFQGR